MILPTPRDPRVAWRQVLAASRRGAAALNDRRRRAHALAVTLPVAAALATWLTAAALAANWDGPIDGDQGWGVAGSLAGQGSDPVDFTQCDLTASVHDHFHSNNDHDIAPTDITPNGTHACSTIDVGVGDDNFNSLVGSGVRGFAECHEYAVYPAVCNVAHAHINLGNVDIPENFFLTLRTVCHEVGHTVGLRHRVSSADSCMWTGAATSAHLDSHDTNVLNDHY